MEERNTKRKRMVSSQPKIESVTENTNKPSTKPSTSQSLLEIENVQQNGTAAAIGSSLLKIVDERGNGTKNRRSNNIILNEEIQKEERADKKEESIATKTNRVYSRREREKNRSLLDHRRTILASFAHEMPEFQLDSHASRCINV